MLNICPGCGSRVFKEVFSEYEICPICWYQDCFWSIEKPHLAWLEWETSLLDYQKIFYTKWLQDESWWILDSPKLDKDHLYFPAYKYEEFCKKYWNIQRFDELFKEAQKYNPDKRVHIE